MTLARRSDRRRRKGQQMAKKRKRHNYEFKQKVVDEYLGGGVTAQELGRKHGVHPANIYQWSKQLKDGTMNTGPTKRERELEKKLALSESKVGQLIIERDLLKKLQEEISQRQKRSAGLRNTVKKPGQS